MIKKENLVLWLNAEDIEGSIGDRVNNWKGSGGTLIDAINPNTNKSPTLEKIDDLKYVFFNGSERLDLTFNIFDNNNPMTIVALINPLSNGHIIGNSTSSSPYYTYLKGLCLDNGRYGISARSRGNGMLLETANNSYQNKIELITARFKNKDSNLETFTETVIDKTSNLDFYPYQKSTIGASDGSNLDRYINPFQGYISEILVFNTYLTDDEIRMVRDNIRLRKILKKKYLVSEFGTYKYYNQQSDSWDIISEELDSSVFEQLGVSKITSVNSLSDEFKVLVWIPEDLGELDGVIRAIPKPQMAYPIGDISLVGVETVDRINILSTNNTKTAISFNSGITWKKFNNGIWVEIVDAQDGMTNIELNSLTSQQIEMGRDGSTKIRFSYYLEGIEDVDNLEMKVSLQGHEELAETKDFDISYDQNTSKIIYSIKKDGSFSVNYVDSE